MRTPLLISVFCAAAICTAPAHALIQNFADAGVQAATMRAREIPRHAPLNSFDGVRLGTVVGTQVGAHNTVAFVLVRTDAGVRRIPADKIYVRQGHVMSAFTKAQIEAAPVHHAP